VLQINNFVITVNTANCISV